MICTDDNAALAFVFTGQAVERAFEIRGVELATKIRTSNAEKVSLIISRLCVEWSLDFLIFSSRPKTIIGLEIIMCPFGARVMDICRPNARPIPRLCVYFPGDSNINTRPF